MDEKMATFLLEVGTEELPAGFVDEALTQWRSRIPQSLAEHHLIPSAIAYYGTPRRLAVLISGLPEQQADQDEEVKGPPAQAAFKDGQPTKAAAGFAQKQGVAVEALEVRSTDKGDFVFVRKLIKGRPVADLLPELVLPWITNLEGKRLMRWADGEIKFSRPIRWLVALLDHVVLPITITSNSISCTSDRVSQGHRVLHPAPITLATAGEYVETLRSAFVEVDSDRRQQLIETQAKAAAQAAGGVAVINPTLLREVTNLVEYPTAVIGQFEAAFLELPPEVIITEMESHQRYFPIRASATATALLPYFITTSNGDPAKSDIIAAGNARVIRARLSDGKFFFDADRTQPLEAYLPKLETVTFQQDLGSVRVKVDRIVAIANLLAAQLQVSGPNLAYIQRAALLCKADLVTQMVGEFPELQGVMGEKYARSSGEPEAVATAIVEHYLPKGADDALPQTLIGQVIGLADRCDTLVSIFGLGLVPTGSSDPFALRRAANAVINITWTANLKFDLLQLLEQIVADFSSNYISVMKLSVTELVQQMKDFFLQRIQTLLRDDYQIDYDLVNAVIGENDPEYADRALRNLLEVRDRAQFLQTIRQDGRMVAIYETVNRASRLAAQGTLDTQQLSAKVAVKSVLFQKTSEQDFFDALSHLQNQTSYEQLVVALTEIAPTVSRFFDGDDSVLVMDPDPAIKQNRLNLLGILRNYARMLADFNAIVKS